MWGCGPGPFAPLTVTLRMNGFKGFAGFLMVAVFTGPKVPGFGSLYL